eukprot:1844219-Alexandrium_andersonii.AAC.1
MCIRDRFTRQPRANLPVYPVAPCKSARLPRAPVQIGPFTRRPRANRKVFTRRPRANRPVYPAPPCKTVSLPGGPVQIG